jgi:hypothetical protein
MNINLNVCLLPLSTGALYPMLQAQAMVNLCATVGASTCYLLSYALGRGMIKRYMPKMMDSFQAKVHISLSSAINSADIR